MYFHPDFQYASSILVHASNIQNSIYNVRLSYRKRKEKNEEKKRRNQRLNSSSD